MNKDIGTSASQTALGSAVGHPGPDGHGPSGAIASADVMEAVDRLHKFAVEWGFMKLRSGYTDTIYELHPGDHRHAELRFEDLSQVLETFNDR